MFPQPAQSACWPLSRIAAPAYRASGRGSSRDPTGGRFRNGLPAADVSSAALIRGSRNADSPTNWRPQNSTKNLVALCLRAWRERVVLLRAEAVPEQVIEATHLQVRAVTSFARADGNIGPLERAVEYQECLTSAIETCLFGPRACTRSISYSWCITVTLASVASRRERTLCSWLSV